MKRLKIPFLYLLSIISSVLPMLAYFFANLERYVSTPSDSLRLGVGGVILLSIIVLKALGKLKSLSPVCSSAILFALCYFLGSIVKDIMIFSFLSLIGEIVSSIFRVILHRALLERERGLCAEKTKRELEPLISQLTGGRA